MCSSKKTKQKATGKPGKLESLESWKAWKAWKAGLKSWKKSENLSETAPTRLWLLMGLIDSMQIAAKMCNAKF